MEKASLAGQFALDLVRVGELAADKRVSADNASLQEAARQFEAMFTEKMLSSMRDAYLKADLGRGPQTDFYESLMDKQWAQQVAGEGLGLADQLVKQLTATQQYQGTIEAADRPDTSQQDSPG
jgi:flagellar protein FlgJ